MSNNLSKEIQHLLYEDEDGRVIGLDEVQLLDPIPLSRVSQLRELLSEDDLYLVFQAALILTAWGDAFGLRKIEELVDKRIDQTITIAPHRIYDYDNVYDEMADAIGLFELSSEEMTDERKRILEKLLNLYGEMEFESKLKHTLLKSDFISLLPSVEKAVERANNFGKIYLASNLLPVLGKWHSLVFHQWIEVFAKSPDQTPNPKYNVIESFDFLPQSEKAEIKNLLLTSSDLKIADLAKVASGSNI